MSAEELPAARQRAQSGSEVAALRRRVKALGRELARSNERLEESQRITRIGSWDWDLAGDRVFCSPETLRLFGLAPGEMLRNAAMFLGRIHPDDRPEVEGIMAAAVETGADSVAEFRVIRGDGSEVRVLSQGRCVRGAAGAIERFYGTVQDITETRCVQQRIQDQARLLDLMFRHSIDSILLLDRDFGVIRASDSFEATTGLPVAEIAGKNPFRVFASGIEAEAVTVKRTRRARNWAATPVAFGAYGGAPAYMDVGLAPILNDAGEIELFILTLKDETDRVRSDMARRQSEERLQLVMDGSSDGIWDWKLSTGEFYLSPRAKEILGFGDDELPNRESAFFGRIHPDDADKFQEALGAHNDCGQPCKVELRMQHKSGGWRWILCRGSVIRDDGERPLRMAGSIRDITDRKEAEVQLRESEAYHRLILSSLQEVVVVADTEGRIRSVNGAAKTVFGFGTDELLGQNVGRLMGAEDAGNHDLYMRGFRHTGKPRVIGGVDREVLARHRDGTSIPVEITVNDGMFGGQPGFVAVIRDISDRKNAEQGMREAEDRLRRAQKMEAIGQLTGGLAHDFNNLLSVIQGNAELLSMGNPVELRPVRSILRATKRAENLVKRLLAYSRRQTLQPQSAEIAALVTGMEDLIRMTVGETIDVSVSLADDLWTVLVDPGQLEDAILNLTINARDAMPHGGALSIEAGNDVVDARFRERFPFFTEGNYVRLSIADTGTGMPESVIERAFDPFFTTKEVGKGSGLGLSMVYGFVKQSDGFVILESAEDQGTAVTIYLPRAEARAEESANETPRDTPMGRGERILLVEGDVDVRALTAATLRDLGYVVAEAENAEAARRNLAAARFDLVLSDIALPGGTSGPDLADEVRAVNPDKKVLFMSGYALRNDTSEYVRKRLLSKPFRRHELASALKGVMDSDGKAAGLPPRANPAP